jgi:ABC-type lipoprotein release transport system permease subunit
MNETEKAIVAHVRRYKPFLEGRAQYEYSNKIETILNQAVDLVRAETAEIIASAIERGEYKDKPDGQ